MKPVLVPNIVSCPNCGEHFAFDYGFRRVEQLPPVYRLNAEGVPLEVDPVTGLVDGQKLPKNHESIAGFPHPLEE